MDGARILRRASELKSEGTEQSGSAKYWNTSRPEETAGKKWKRKDRGEKEKTEDHS
jgi:hypothetical protein